MEKQSREAYYESTHLQTIQFEIAREVVRRLLQAQEGGGGRPAAHQLFPQAFRIVQEYTERRVDYRGCDPREIGLDRYAGEIANRLFTAIRPDDAAGERRLLPLLNRYHPILDSGAVDFKTVKPCYETARSHVNLVAGDTKSWEQATAFSLEASDHVECYVRNDHLGLHIPYEYNRLPRTYVPDFVVRLKDGTHLVLEVKGREREEDREKHTAAERWAEAVTNWGKLGSWRFAVCRDPQQFDMLLADPLAEAS